MATPSTSKKPQRSRPAKKAAAAGTPSIIAQLAAIGDAVPDEVLKRLPRDAAKNLDHYLDGSPKQQ